MAKVAGSGAPTALKILRGGHPERINTDEPQPQPGVPECPSRDPKVREVWDYTVRQLLVMRTLTMGDRDALHAYCEQVVAHRQAAKMIREDGPIVQTPRGMVKHPATSLLRESAAMIRAIGRDFGLTPAARTAIKVADQQPTKQTQAGPSRLLSG